MSEARVKVDLNYCLDTAAGSEKGLSVKDLEAFGHRLESVHKELEEERKLGQHAFRDLPSDDVTRDEVNEYAAWARERFSDVLVIGVGGSGNGPEAVVQALSHPYQNLLTPEQRGPIPRVFFLHSTDPIQVRATLDIVDLSRTLVVLITKSGNSTETWANFAAVYEPLKAAVPAEDLKDHVAVVCDTEQGELARLASEMNFRAFSIPKGVASRYGVFSPAGLLPMALAGHSIDEFLDGGREIDELCRQNQSVFRNPAYAFALVHYLMDELKEIKQTVFFPYSERLAATGDWFRQLWAESLGKKTATSGDIVNAGCTPIRSNGPADHSQMQLYVEGPKDKLVAFVEIGGLSTLEPIPNAFPSIDNANYLGGKSLGELLVTQKRASEYQLARAGRPSITLQVPALDSRSMGQLMMQLMIAATVGGKLYEVNPYDQPAVEEGKIATWALMGKKAYAEKKPEYVGRYPKHDRFVV